MTPYLNRDGVTLYHGDARVVLPELDLAGAVVVTDPVWPTRRADLWPTVDAFALARDVLAAVDRGGAKAVIVVLGEVQDPRFLTCVPARFSFFRATRLDFARVSYAGQRLINGDTGYVFGAVPGPRNRVLPGRVLSRRPTPRGKHPCARNSDHMRWLVQHYTEPKDLILDPFAGSGTTLLAGQDLGRRVIGVEIEERWCAEVDRRLAQRVMFASEDGI